jgi:hypothetical protein
MNKLSALIIGGCIRIQEKGAKRPTKIEERGNFKFLNAGVSFEG